MNLFLLNILFALLWGAVSGSFAPGALLFGFIVGYVVLLLARPMLGPSAYYASLWRAFSFAGFFVYELFKSSLIVAWDVLTPGMGSEPAVVAYPLELKSDAAITLLANTISLTPGTLSIDVSQDRKHLYVHSMYQGNDPAAIRAGLRKLEVRIKSLVEPDYG